MLSRGREDGGCDDEARSSLEDREDLFIRRDLSTDFN